MTMWLSQTTVPMLSRHVKEQKRTNRRFSYQQVLPIPFEAFADKPVLLPDHLHDSAQLTCTGRARHFDRIVLGKVLSIVKGVETLIYSKLLS